MRIAATLFSILCTAFFALAADPVPSVSAPANLPQAYAMALQATARLQARADRLRAEGKPAGNAHRMFAIRAGLNNSESDSLDRVAARLRMQLKPLDDRAVAVIQASRAKFPGGRLPKGVAPPPPPAELGELQRQRDGFLRQAVRDLEGELGTAGYAKLGAHLKESMLQGAPGRRTVRTPDDIGPRVQPVAPGSAKKGGNQ
jgi:hypothetical protein